MSDTETCDLLVLSPHLDDGVVSAGGLIHRARARGERVLLVTVFTADEPNDLPSKLARDLHRWFGIGRSVLEERRREDLAACAILGVEARHLDLPDAVYRTDDSTGRAFYRDLGSLFAQPRSADTRQILPLLENHFSELPVAGRTLAPLGIGGHVDHRLVRAAAERAFGAGDTELLFYEDFPYVRKMGALRLVLKPRREWRRVVISLSEEDLAARIEATAAYASQIDPLFGSPLKMAKRTRRYARRAGGERLWQKR